MLPKNDQPIKQLTGIKDLDLKILSNLSYNDLLSVETTSRYMRELLKSKYFWLSKLEKDFPLRSKYVYYKKYLDLKREDYHPGVYRINREDKNYQSQNVNPRKLYEIINQQSRQINLSDYVDEADYEVLNELFDEYDNEEYENLPKITEIVKKYLKELPLLRGDALVIDDYNYRNTGRLIWDGEKVLSLNFDIDEYGSVAKEMMFPEFPLNHFHTTIDHNTIIWLAPETVQEAINNMNIENNTSEVSDMYYKYPLKIWDDNFRNVKKESLVSVFLRSPVIQVDIENYNQYVMIGEYTRIEDDEIEDDE